ncbi:MAG TPA: hypothetical protein VI299_20570 [Polyangiales bacterium]
MTLLRTLAALALLAVGFAAGTVAPHAAASDPADGIVHELREIRGEITSIRRALEKR